MIENLIFSFNGADDIAVIPEKYNKHTHEGDFIAQVSIRSGFRLVGLQSVDKEVEGAGRVIDKMKFLFIDLANVHCRPPTDLLVRDFSLVFHQYDTDEDGLITDYEFNKIMNKLGKDRITLSAADAPLAFTNF